MQDQPKELIYVFNRTGRHTHRALGDAASPASEIPAVARILAAQPHRRPTQPATRVSTDTVTFSAAFLREVTA